MMQDLHVKLNTGLPWLKQRSARRFSKKLRLNLGNKLLKCYVWNLAFYDAET
jgi:hypothetical protein